MDDMDERAGTPPPARRRGAQQHRALIASLVLALIGAPALSALPDECTLCPRTCPMHQHGSGAAAAPHATCHMAATQSAPHAHNTSDRGPALTCAACGKHGGSAATVLPQVLLTVRQRLPYPVSTDAAPAPEAFGYARASDPPDTPPPITAA